MIVLLQSGLIFFLASLVQGLSGFGGGLVAIPLLCLIMDAKEAIPLSLLSGLATTTYMTYGLRAQLDWRKILPLLLGSIPGVLVGALFLKEANSLLITQILGGVLISISVFNLLFAPRPRNPSTAWGYVAGFFSGSITAAVGAGGPPVIIYATLTDWKKDVIKATLTGFFVLNGYFTAAVYTVNSMITLDILLAFAFSLAFALAGTWVGGRISGLIRRRTYLQMVYGLLLILGVVMLTSR